MVRTNGLKINYKPIERISETDNIYKVRWDYADMRNVSEDGTTDTDYAVWAEEIFYHKPMMEDVKALIRGYYNNITDNKILSGFVWNEMEVWLSEENQRNYKAAYDIAVQSGLGLPVEFKFGTANNPTYQVFHTVEELGNFYLAAVAYVQQCYTDGWRIKDAIDWGVYEI